MNDHEYKRIFKKARAYAVKRGFADEADDFAQEYAIQCLKCGFDRKLEWSFKDYSDAQRADKRILSSPAGYLSKDVTVRINFSAERSGENQSEFGDHIGAARNDMDSIRNNEQYRQILTDKEYMIYEMFFIENQTLKSIGNYFGFTESRSHQYIKIIKNKIKHFENNSDIINNFLLKIDNIETRKYIINLFKKGIKNNVFNF